MKEFLEKFQEASEAGYLLTIFCLGMIIGVCLWELAHYIADHTQWIV